VWRETLPLVGLFSVTLVTGAVSLVWVARATERFWIAGLAGLVQPVLFLGCWWSTRLLLPGLLSVPAAAIGSELVLAAGLFVWARRCVGPLKRPSASVRIRELLWGAAPIGASQLLRVVALGSDLVLLGLLVSFQQVGLYAGAYRVFTVGVSLATAYFMVLLPRLARSSAKSPAALGSELRSSLRRTIVPALAAVAIGVLAAGELLERLFGQAFREAEPALQLLALTGAVFVLNGHTRTTLIASGRQRRNMMHIAVGAVVHVSGKLALIPLFGTTGAAAGTLLGETVLLLLGWYAVRGLLQPSPDGSRTVAGERMRPEPGLAAN
jgi:O-antigen/teichoic acid export membrane protein